jgi:uncharacterized protein (DUF2147 family)
MVVNTRKKHTKKKGNMIMKAMKACAGIVLLLVIGAASMFAQDLSPALKNAVGKWQCIQNGGKVGGAVETWIHEGKLYGKMIKSRDGGLVNCDGCSGDQKGKPIVGLVVISALSPDGDIWEGGTITDPESGKVYKAKVRANGDDLLVRGFIGFSMIGRTETWKRIK